MDSPTPTPPTGDPDIKFPVAPASAPRGDPPKFKLSGETPMPSNSMIHKTIDVIRAAANEQRGFAGQIIDPPKVKASFLEKAADLERAATRVEELERELSAATAALEEAKYAYENQARVMRELQERESVAEQKHLIEKNAARELKATLAARDLELKGLREDAERINWLHKNARWHDPAKRMTVHFPMDTVEFTGLRATIDAARAKDVPTTPSL